MSDHQYPLAHLFDSPHEKTPELAQLLARGREAIVQAKKEQEPSHHEHHKKASTQGREPYEQFSPTVEQRMDESLEELKAAFPNAGAAAAGEKQRINAMLDSTASGKYVTRVPSLLDRVRTLQG